MSLTDAPRDDLEARSARPLALRERNRVRVLLRADAGETNADVPDGLGIAARPRRTSAGGSRPRDGTRPGRNRAGAEIEWTFRVADARKKLDPLYPKELVRCGTR